MNPISIDIYDESALRFLERRLEKVGQSPVQTVIEALRLMMGDEPEMLIDHVVVKLTNEYARLYEERFDVAAIRENGTTERLIVAFINNLRSSDNEKVVKVLIKAVKWYLYFHDNTDAQGQSFPYGLKYLFSDKSNWWLIRSCIESSKKIDDKVFQLMAEKKLTKEEALRTIRRGDEGTVGKQESVTELLQQAFQLLKVIKTKRPDAFERLRNNPAFKGLFQPSPTREYVEKITTQLQNLVNAIPNDSTNI